MSYASKNVIPGNRGKVFSTNAKEDASLEKIKEFIEKLEGVESVSFDHEVFPREFTVRTSKVVEVSAVEEAVIESGFHAVPKHLLPIDL